MLREIKVNISEVNSPQGEVITRYEFPSFEDLERFFINNFEQLTREGYSTKVVGKVLLQFKYNRSKT